MPRPRKAIRPTEKSVNIPSDITARVDLELFSEVEGRVPVGAWSTLITGLLRQWLAKRGQEVPEEAKPVTGDELLAALDQEGTPNG